MILLRKVRSALKLFAAGEGWKQLAPKAGENVRAWNVWRHRDKPFFYPHQHGFRFVVLPQIPESRDIYVHRNDYEAVESRIMQTWLQPGDLAIDCGANIGLISALMADRVGRSGLVCAVEAAPVTAARLRHVMQALQLPQVKIIEKCVADRGGHIFFDAGNPRSDQNSISGETGEKDGRGGCQTASVTLDEMLFDAQPAMPALVKLDIEGAEPLAFRGWKKLHSTNGHPLLVFEVYPRGLTKLGFEPSDIFAAIPQKDYTFWAVNFSWPNNAPEIPRGIPIRLRDPLDFPWPTHSNVIGVPRRGTFASRSARLKAMLD